MKVGDAPSIAAPPLCGEFAFRSVGASSGRAQFSDPRLIYRVGEIQCTYNRTTLVEKPTEHEIMYHREKSKVFLQLGWWPIDWIGHPTPSPTSLH